LKCRLDQLRQLKVGGDEENMPKDFEKATGTEFSGKVVMVTGISRLTAGKAYR